MPIIILILNLLAVNIAIAAESLQFKELEWDFGTIEEMGGRVSHVFEFTNSGETPVIIHGARATCGCTEPTYSRKPIMSGESNTLKVTFDPLHRPGRFVKDIYMYIYRIEMSL